MFRALLLTLLLGVIAAIAVPNFIRARTTRSKNVCADGALPQILQAKQAWARANGAAATSIPTAQDLQPYFPGRQLPTCPAGGSYSMNPMNRPPTCSDLEHSRVFLQDHWARP